MAIPLGRPLPAASSNQPGQRSGDGSKVFSVRTPYVAPIRFCSRWGLPCRPCCHGRGALLPHRFTLASRRFVFCGAFPGVSPAGRYPAPCLRGARTFLRCERGGHPAGWLKPHRWRFAYPSIIKRENDTRGTNAARPENSQIWRDFHLDPARWAGVSKPVVAASRIRLIGKR